MEEEVFVERSASLPASRRVSESCAIPVQFRARELRLRRALACGTAKGGPLLARTPRELFSKTGPFLLAPDGESLTYYVDSVLRHLPAEARGPVLLLLSAMDDVAKNKLLPRRITVTRWALEGESEVGLIADIFSTHFTSQLPPSFHGILSKRQFSLLRPSTRNLLHLAHFWLSGGKRIVGIDGEGGGKGGADDGDGLLAPKSPLPSSVPTPVLVLLSEEAEVGGVLGGVEVNEGLGRRVSVGGGKVVFCSVVQWCACVDKSPLSPLSHLLSTPFPHLTSPSPSPSTLSTTFEAAARVAQRNREEVLKREEGRRREAGKREGKGKVGKIVEDEEEVVEELSLEGVEYDKGASAMIERGAVYPEHWDEGVVERELREGRVVKGKVMRTRRGKGSRAVVKVNASMLLKAMRRNGGDGEEDEDSAHLPTISSSTLSTSFGSSVVEVACVGRAAVNRALPGDVVVLRVLPRELWRNRGEESEEALPPETQAATRGTVAALNDGEEEEEEVVIGEEGSGESGGGRREVEGERACCAVVRIVKRHRPEFVATILHSDVSSLSSSSSPSSSSSSSSGVVVATPMDIMLPRVRVATADAASLAGHRLVVALDEWSCRDLAPRGHIVRVLGESGKLETEVRSVLVETKAEGHLRPFNPAIFDELPDPHTWTPSPSPLSHPTPPTTLPKPLRKAIQRREDKELDEERLDLRDIEPACSIDPPGCEDIDDALSVREVGECGRRRVRVGVHIADVSHFVALGSSLDAEARSRGTTVYLPDRRLDMLPSVLSANLCSLRARVDRYALSVLCDLEQVESEGDGGDGGKEEWKIVPGRIWMGPTVIRSSHALTYAQAQSIVDETTPSYPTSFVSTPLPPDPPEGGVCGAPVHTDDISTLYPRLTTLTSIAKWLRRERRKAGAVELETSELRFTRKEEGDDGEGDEEGEGEKEEEEEVDGEEVVGMMAVEEEDHADMHFVVAELMIFANSLVAQRCFMTFPSHSLLRRHLPAKVDKAHELLAVSHRLGIEFDVSTGKAMATSLQRVKQAADHGEIDQGSARLVMDLAAKAMMEAEYTASATALSQDATKLGLASVASSETLQSYAAFNFSTSSTPQPPSPPAPFSHYGLGLSFYTHFTSPIRRFADLTVHRLLRLSLGLTVRGAITAPPSHPPSHLLSSSSDATPHTPVASLTSDAPSALELRPHVLKHATSEFADAAQVRAEKEALARAASAEKAATASGSASASASASTTHTPTTSKPSQSSSTPPKSTTASNPQTGVWGHKGTDPSQEPSLFDNLLALDDSDEEEEEEEEEEGEGGGGEEEKEEKSKEGEDVEGQKKEDGSLLDNLLALGDSDDSEEDEVDEEDERGVGKEEGKREEGSLLDDLMAMDDSESESDDEEKERGEGVVVVERDEGGGGEESEGVDVESKAKEESEVIVEKAIVPLSFPVLDLELPILERLAVHLNEQTRAAKLASRECGELMLALMLSRGTGMVVEGVVQSIRKDGVMVFLPRFGVNVPVHLAEPSQSIASATPTIPRFPPVLLTASPTSTLPTPPPFEVGEPVVDASVDERVEEWNRKGWLPHTLPNASFTVSDDTGFTVSTPSSSHSASLPLLQSTLLLLWASPSPSGARPPQLRASLLARTPATLAAYERDAKSSSDSLHHSSSTGDEEMETMDETEEEEEEEVVELKPVEDGFGTLELVPSKSREGELLQRSEGRVVVEIRKKGNGRRSYGGLPSLQPTPSEREGAQWWSRAPASSTSTTAPTRATHFPHSQFTRTRKAMEAAAEVEEEEHASAATGRMGRGGAGATVAEALSDRARLHHVEREVMDRTLRLQAQKRDTKIKARKRAAN